MIPPTRSHLQRLRRQLLVARHGHALLKRKQDALLLEFYKLWRLALAQRRQLQEEHARAARLLAQARALESDLRIKAAALAVQEAAPVQITVRNVAGVRLPELGGVAERAVPRYDSLLLQDVGAAYFRVIEAVVRLAARETALRKVLLEIKRVKRRTKALEEVVIPRLQEERQYVVLSLDEREREEFLRIRKRIRAQ
jgi:V/A-type H+-transporting ATPase subunit D